jgi:hypothetical protein
MSEEIVWSDLGDERRWPSMSALAVDFWATYAAIDEPLGDSDDHQFSASMCADDLAEHGDPRILPLVEVLAATAPDRQALFFLGAGVLENLVRAQGDAVVDDLVALAARSPRVRIALSGVWLARPPGLAPQTLAILTPWLVEDDVTPFG